MILLHNKRAVHTIEKLYKFLACTYEQRLWVFTEHYVVGWQVESESSLPDIIFFNIITKLQSSLV